MHEYLSHFPFTNLTVQTPVSLCAPLVHMDSSVFPQPGVFDPDRWIKAVEEGVNLNKYLVNFSRGSRVCLGISMAYAELYLALARIVRRFEMDLYETTEEDIETYHVRLTGYPRKGRGEVKVKITVNA